MTNKTKKPPEPQNPNEHRYWKCCFCDRFNKVLADTILTGDELVCCFCKKYHFVHKTEKSN